MRRFEKINSFLEIPKEIVYSIPKVTIIGFEEMYIENYIGILEYEEYFVRVSTNIGNVSINGFNLKLIEMTKDTLKIIGKLESVDFERRSI